MKLVTRSLSLVALGLFSVSSFATAQTISYTNQAAFLANVAPNPYLENFNGLSNGTAYGLSLNLSGNGYAYTASATHGLYGAAGNSGSSLSTNMATDPLVFTFTGTPVTALGGNFFASDLNGSFASRNITIGLSNGFSVVLPTPALNAFNGFTVASGSITSLSVSAVNGAGTPFRWPTVDNLIVGSVNAPTAVPEPGSVALLIGMTSMGGMLLRRRNRK